jgi:hypothetical protein
VAQGGGEAAPLADSVHVTVRDGTDADEVAAALRARLAATGAVVTPIRAWPAAGEAQSQRGNRFALLVMPGLATLYQGSACNQWPEALPVQPSNSRRPRLDWIDRHPINRFWILISLPKKLARMRLPGTFLEGQHGDSTEAFSRD